MARSASRSSMTHEMLISLAPIAGFSSRPPFHRLGQFSLPWDIISMLTLFSPRVENIFPAIPIMFFICFPTRLRMAMPSIMSTVPYPLSSSIAPRRLWSTISLLSSSSVPVTNTDSECNAIDTCTSDVEMRSIDSLHLSRVENILAKNPWDSVRLFEWTLMTKILCLIVNAVGRLGRWSSDNKLALRVRNILESWLDIDELSLPGSSGEIKVPEPRGFVTFLIRIGILAWMTCCMVKGCMTSEP